MKDNDLKLVEEEIVATDLIKSGEYIVMDRGFISLKETKLKQALI